MNHAWATATPFAIIPIWLMLLDVPDKWKLIYGVLNGAGGGGKRRIFIGHLKPRRVRDHLTDMEKAGLISKVKSGGKTKQYILKEPESIEELKVMLPAKLTDDEKDAAVRAIRLGRSHKKLEAKKTLEQLTLLAKLKAARMNAERRSA
jgi:hypothetical protein